MPGEPNVLRREYFTKDSTFFDDRERAFLSEVDALSVCPEINLIMLLVRYPQPDAIYTVRWTVPDDLQAKQFTDDERRNLIALRSAFISADHPGVRGFYERLSFLLRRLAGWERLSFYLLGYDEKGKYLRVVHGPDPPRPYWSLRVGRGATGTAFKTLQSEYYEKGRIRLGAGFDYGDGTYYVEPLYEGFDPNVLLAIPLVYPQLLNSPGGSELLYGRSFAVLAIAADFHAPALAQFNPLRSLKEGGLDASEAKQGIDRLYNIAGDALRERIDDIVPTLRA